jgi:hypothetical protein
LKGDVIPEVTDRNIAYKGKKPRRRKYSCWKIKSTIQHSYNIEDYIKDIIERINPVRSNFKKLPKKVNLMLCVWIDIYSPYESMPSIALDLKTMSFLLFIKAELDIDISLVFDPGIK